MPILVVPANVMACQIDDFPDGCKRSREGALYVRPASTMDVTDDEYDHMQKAHPQLAARMIVASNSPSLATRIKQKEKGKAKVKAPPPKKEEPKKK